MFLSFSYSNVFVRYVCLRLQIFGVLRKENNSIPQYAVMFNKEIIYSWNCRFVIKVSAVSPKVCVSYDFIIKNVQV